MRHRRIAIAFAVSSLCSALLGVSPASAEISLGVTPAVLDLAAPAGGSGSVEVRVDNDGSDAFEVTTSVFELDNDPVLPSAVAWSEVTPKRLRVEPGDTGVLTLALDVPRKTAPGGHYAALSIATAPLSDEQEGPNAAGVAGRIVVPVLIAVSSDDRVTPEAVPLLERSALFLQSDGSLVARADIHNHGGTHIALQGEAQVRRPNDGPTDDPLFSAEIPVGRVLPETTRTHSAFTSFRLAPDSLYDVSLKLGETDGGRYHGAPLIDDTFRVRTTADVSLDDLALCSTPDGTMAPSVSILNEGALGVSPSVAFWVEAPGVGRVAAAQQVHAPRSWPQDSVHISSTFNKPIGDGEYVLVADVSYGPDQTLQAELPFTVADEVAAVPAC